MAFTNKAEVFRHTTEEKMEFLQDFLQQINVDK